jgi:hypothetical protein
MAVCSALLIAGLACGKRSAPAPTFASLHGDAAQVGTVPIPVPLVATVARSRRVGARQALSALVEDALLAQGARAADLDRTGPLRWAETTMLARKVLDQARDDAGARGAPTDGELVTIRVVHAVVRRSATLDHARAVAIADAIRTAVSGARNDDEFEARAKQVLHGGAQVTIERVPEFDVAGRTNDGAEIDARFVAAALELRGRGDTSDIVETAFGWHVIRLMDRVPPDPELLARRRVELADAVLDVRARMALANALRAVRLRVPVEVDPAAKKLMAEAVASGR